MKILLSLLAAPVLAAPALAGGAPTVKLRTVPANVQSLRVNSAVDPSGARLLSATPLVTPGVSLNATLDAIPNLASFNVAETLEMGRIEAVRNIDVLRGVSSEKISADIAFDGGSTPRKITAAVPGSESIEPNGLKRSVIRDNSAKTLPAPAKMGKAALLTGLFSALPIALHADGLDGLLESLPYLGLFGVAVAFLFAIGSSISESDSDWSFPWEKEYKAFIKDLKSRPGVAKVHYYRDSDWEQEWLYVYFHSEKAMEQTELPDGFYYRDRFVKSVTVRKQVLPPRKPRRWWQLSPDDGLKGFEV